MIRLLSLLPLFFCFASVAQQQKKVEDYISQFREIAIREMKEFGIPASIKMGQGILESAAGTSELAINARNHFGIKCKKDWTGQTYTYDDDAKGECFRKYDAAIHSFEDHSKFLKNNPRYAELFSLDPLDYKAWAYGLKKAGYATNPKYSEQLIKTIEDYRLYELDKPVTLNQPLAKTEPEKTDQPDLADFTTGKKEKHVVMVRNRVKYIIVRPGDTYEKLIKDLSLMSWELYRYNDLPRTAKAKEGEIIYLQPKRRKAEQASHQVKAGESLRDISQQYAVKLRRLKKLNHLDERSTLSPGQTLKLR